MKKILGKVTPTVAAVSAALVVGGGTGAVAATGMIHTRDIADGAVTSPKIGAGAVHLPDIADGAQSSLTASGDKAAKDVTSLKQQVTDLQSQVTSLRREQINGTWHTDAGTVRPTDEGIEVTEASDDSAGAGASNNALRDYKSGDKITVEGTMSGGAAAGQGSPRAYIVIGGVAYTSVDNTNPDYGASGDGHFSESLVPVSYDGTSAPSGEITQTGLVYDNTSAPGTVTFTSLKIGDTDIPLS